MSLHINSRYSPILVHMSSTFMTVQLLCSLVLKTQCQDVIVGVCSIDSQALKINSQIFYSTGCTTGDLRLVGGSYANQGRVEVCNNGVWGTVCHDFWSSVDASVACRQLGFSRNCKCVQYPMFMLIF